MINAILTFITTHLSITLRNIIIAEAFFGIWRRVIYISFITFFAWTIPFSLESYITFPVFFCTLAYFFFCYYFKFFSIIATGCLFSSNISQFFSQQAFRRNLSVRSPVLIMRISSTRFIKSFTGMVVNLRKISHNYYSLLT